MMSLSGRMPLGVHSHRACRSSLIPSSGGRSAQANSTAALLSAPTKTVRCVFECSLSMRVGMFRGAGETSLEIGLSSTECTEPHITQNLRSVGRKISGLISQ
jgi:hypothetical protein